MEQNNQDQIKVQNNDPVGGTVNPNNDRVNKTMVLNNKFPCGMVRDLLPLYRDNACGEDSRRIVEEHLAECPDCSEILEQLSDPVIDDIEEKLSAESTIVLEKHHKKEHRTAVTAGTVTAGILIIPLIVCLVINLASGNGLSWFYIVLTSLMTAASVTVVPMLSAEHRFAKTIGAFTVSVVWLLMSICLCTGGSWLFVAAVPVIFGMSLFFAPAVVRDIPLPDCLKNRKTLLVVLWDVLWLFTMLGEICVYTDGKWFSTAAIAITLGLSVILMPILIKQIPLPKPFCDHKALLVMIWDTVWLYTLLFDCAKYVDPYGYYYDYYDSRLADYIFNSIWITAVCLLVPWTMFILIRYTKLHPFTKTGLCILIPAMFGAVANDIITFLYRPHGTINAPSVIGKVLNVIMHREPVNIDFTVTSIVFSSVIALGVIFIGIGIFRTLLKRKR